MARANSPVIFYLLTTLMLAILASASRARSAEKALKPASVRIAVVSRGTLDLPFWVAKERGFFRDEGIDAEIILFKASLTVQAMLGGSIDFGTATGTAVSAAVNGADVRIIMAMSERPSFDLMGHAQHRDYPATARQENRFRWCRRSAGNYYSTNSCCQPNPHRPGDVFISRRRRCLLHVAACRCDRCGDAANPQHVSRPGRRI